MLLHPTHPACALSRHRYVNHDKDVTTKLVRRAEAGGCKALFVTVDAPQLGRREKDMRNKFTLEGTDVQKKDDKKGKVRHARGRACPWGWKAHAPTGAPPSGRLTWAGRATSGSLIPTPPRCVSQVGRNEGTARAISQFIDPSLNWKQIAWLKTITKLPIILKGVQCYEDALLAVEAGCQGIVCSNHGGRQMDCARSGIEVLVEVMDALKARGLQDKLEVR